jgi:hypothetical protein
MLLALPFINAQASTSTVNQRVSSYIFEGEELNLLEELNVNSKKVQIEQVKVKLQATQHASDVQIILNDKVLKSTKIKGLNKNLTVSIPHNTKVKSLTLRADAIFVKKVSAIVNKKTRSNLQTVKVVVKQRVNGSQKINLMELMSKLNIAVDSHQEVESIAIKSKGRGLISISAGNSHEGSVLVRRKQSVQRIKTHSLENQLRDIDLVINGKVSLRSVTVKLKPIEAPM